MSATERKKPIGLNKRFHPSLRTALMLATGFAVAPALAIIVWSGYENGARLTEQARAQAQRQADSFAEIQTRVAASAERLLATLASLEAIRGGNPAEAEALLRSAHGANPDYVNLTLTDRNGIVIASSRAKPGTDLSGRDHIKRAREGRRFCSGEYFRNLVDDSPTEAFSYPIIDGSGEVRSILSLAIRLSSNGEFFERLELPKDSVLGLVDRNGVRLFFHPPKETNPIGGRIKESVWNRIRTGSRRANFTDVGSDGVSRFYSYTSLTLPGNAEPYVHVVYATPNKALGAASRAALSRNLAIMAAVALAAFAGAGIVAQRLFGRRFVRVIDVADRIREGDLGARAALEGDASEIGRLAASVDSMAETLQSREAETARYAATLGKSLAEKEILLKEVHHRVKNNLQMIVAMIKLQDPADDPEAFREGLENRIASMAVLHEMLYKADDMRAVDLGEYAHRIVELIAAAGPKMRLETDFEPVSCGIDKAVNFGLLLNELVLNAYKHAFAGGRTGNLEISLRAEGSDARLTVRDDGPGLPDDFSVEKCSSLGLRLVDSIADQLGGAFSWENASPGARFTVTFPPTDRA